MRDAHRLKDKFDLSLDSGQIVSILIGGLVVLGAVFVLGVVVGKKLSVNQRASQAPDLLTALDQKSANLEHLRTDPPLTFQEELTKKKVDPPAPVAVRAPAVAVTPKPAAAAPVDDPALGAPEGGKVEPSPVLVRTAAPPKMALPARPTGTVPNGAYTIQIAASQVRSEAERQAARLRDRGYAPYIVAAQVPGKGTWYRVRMGGFPSKEAASRYLADFRRETQLQAFVAATK